MLVFSHGTTPFVLQEGGDDFRQRALDAGSLECLAKKPLTAIGACEPRKRPSYFPLFWMVNRDPYNGL